MGTPNGKHEPQENRRLSRSSKQGTTAVGGMVALGGLTSSVLAGCATAKKGTPADTIYFGGPILTLVKDGDRAEALAVKDGRILAFIEESKSTRKKAVFLLAATVFYLLPDYKPLGCTSFHLFGTAAYYGSDSNINFYAGCPVLDDGILVSGYTGGGPFNPFKSGRTFIELEPFLRRQDVDDLKVTQKTAGVEIALSYDNTDFWVNPGKGNYLRLFFGRDWGAYDDSTPWSVWGGEFSQYFSLDPTEKARHRVFAFIACR